VPITLKSGRLILLETGGSVQVYTEVPFIYLFLIFRGLYNSWAVRCASDGSISLYAIQSSS